MMPGLNGCICNECAEQAFKLSQEYLESSHKQASQELTDAIQDIPTPKELTDYLNQYVSGQESANK